MMTCARSMSIGVALAIVLAGGSVRAQGNYRSAALGGRSALMGDTGVALGADSASPFLNPATIVAQERPTLALSINLVGRVLHVPDWFVPGPVATGTYGNVPKDGDGITRLSGSAIPSTLCFFQPLRRIGAPDVDEGRAGRQHLAICFGTTEHEQFEWIGQGYQAGTVERSVTQSSSVRHSWQRLVLSPTYALHATDALALGVSIQGSLSNYSEFEGVGGTTTGGTLPSTSNAFESGASGSDLGLSALVGAIYTVDRTTVGATVQSPDVSVYGRGSISNSSQLTGASTSTSVYVGRGAFHAREPARLGLGIGYRWPRGSVELDGQLALAAPHALELDSYGTESLAPGTTGTAASLLLTTRYRPTFNASVGGELYLSRAISLLGGFGTDLSAVDTLNATSVAANQMDRLLLSFGVGDHGQGGSLLIGGQAYYGFGRVLAPNAYAADPTPVATPAQSYGMLLILAGTANTRTVRTAVDAVKKAVTGSPAEAK